MITALVSTYNSERFMANRLDNLLDSTIDGLNIYVLDAASPQNEAAIVRQFQNDPRTSKTPIIYERTPERITLYAAWNHMIKKITDKYVTTANTDDIIHPDYYRQAIAMLETGYDMVYCPWYVTPILNQKWPAGGFDGVVDPPLHTTCGHFPVWRRELHNKYGLFDERFRVIGDAEWWRRLHHHNTRLGKFTTPMGCYATRGNDNLYYSAKDENGNCCCSSEEWLLSSIVYDKPNHITRKIR